MENGNVLDFAACIYINSSPFGASVTVETAIMNEFHYNCFIISDIKVKIHIRIKKFLLQ